MNGIRFYEELDNKNRKGEISQGNVIARVLGQDRITDNGVMCETISALFFHPNSVVCGSAASLNYIYKNCRRISEEKAREIHPNLFVYLD